MVTEEWIRGLIKRGELWKFYKSKDWVRLKESVLRDAHYECAECRARGGRVFCVGSTTVRTLETAADENGAVAAGSGASDIFIYPPYDFKVCDCMLTNFHLPQSTLLMMISALAGRERVLCSYAMAVRKEYKFFSYGDCMLIV